MAISGYRIMWVMVIFDLPVTTREYRRAYQEFRGLLLDEGFWQLQYSVYARVAFNEERADTLKRKIEHAVPTRGHVRIMMFTDKQWSRTEVFFGKKRISVEDPPEQLSFF